MIKLINKPRYQIKLQKFKNGGIAKGLEGMLMELLNTPSNSIDFSGIVTTGNRPYNAKNISYINDKLSSLTPLLRSVIIANIIEESGGNPLASSEGGVYNGLLQWGADRYVVPKNANEQKELDNQIKYILETINNTTDKKSWTHGGTGSGYKSLMHAYNTFMDSSLPLDSVSHAFTWGYVRPAGKADSARNRLKVAKQIYKLLK